MCCGAIVAAQSLGEPKLVIHQDWINEAEETNGLGAISRSDVVELGCHPSIVAVEGAVEREAGTSSLRSGGFGRWLDL